MTMTPAQMESDLATANSNLARCQCGSKCVVSYEPGCTFVRCLAEKRDVLAMPDWAPLEISEEWNRTNI